MNKYFTWRDRKVYWRAVSFKYTSTTVEINIVRRMYSSWVICEKQPAVQK